MTRITGTQSGSVMSLLKVACLILADPDEERYALDIKLECFW